MDCAQKVAFNLKIFDSKYIQIHKVPGSEYNIDHTEDF